MQNSDTLGVFYTLMRLSYWEYKTWLTDVDYTIIGSGIVGLTCALTLRSKEPGAKILVLEKGTLPQGASTKNAGFACFGSISEILADLQSHSEEEVAELVRMRYDGIGLLRKNIGDKAMDYRQSGGHELFLKDNEESYARCLQEIPRINNLLEPVFGKEPFTIKPNIFNFKNLQENYLSNDQEGQINTGSMMKALLQKTYAEDITIMNAVTVKAYNQLNALIEVSTDQFDFKTRKLLIATNGFASQITDTDLKPARAQVLITKPIPDLHIKGTFHLDEGYYYFREIDNRILLGGARNLDFAGETTTDFGLTEAIQQGLEDLLKEVIMPGIPFEIDRRWSGIMGLGSHKRPIVKQLSNDAYCGIRLSGMGVAIGSLVGASLAELAI